MILSFKKQFKPKILDETKKHTIREDPHNRWKAGRKIHMATGVRTKLYNCFMKDVCRLTQRINIKWERGFNEKRISKIYIDGKIFAEELTIGYLGEKELYRLAINDGFDTIKEFFEWFDEDFNGKIIHWTDIKY